MLLQHSCRPQRRMARHEHDIEISMHLSTLVISQRLKTTAEIFMYLINDVINRQNHVLQLVARSS